jgi:hypothetical protein
MSAAPRLLGWSADVRVAFTTSRLATGLGSVFHPDLQE